MKWKYLRQDHRQSVQVYMFEFEKQSTMLGISLEELGIVVKYLGGQFSDIQILKATIVL
jgi:hypothetical protein